MKSFKMDYLWKHIEDNLWLYLISILSMTIGIFIGIYSLKYLGQFPKSDLTSYLNSFTKSFDMGKISYSDIFYQCIKNNIPFIILIWFLGLTMIGIPLVLVLDAIKGFSIGFTISFIVNTLGSKGVVVVLLGLIPQNIIYIPCYLVGSTLAIEFSLMIIRDRINKKWSNNLWGRVFSYSATFLVISLILMLGFLIEAYITPNLLKLIVMNPWSYILC